METLEKRLSSKALGRFFNIDLDALIQNPPKVEETQGFSGKLLQCSLQQPRETTMKINGKPCQTLVDAKACRGVPGKIGKRQLKVRILTTVCSPKSLPIIPIKGRGKKKAFCTLSGDAS